MIVYRLALHEDADALVSLLAEIMLHHGVTPPAYERLRATVDTVLVSHDHHFLVADEDGSIVGMCALVFDQPVYMRDALVLAVVSFLGTVAFAYYVARGGKP